MSIVKPVSSLAEIDAVLEPGEEWAAIKMVIPGRIDPDEYESTPDIEFWIARDDSERRRHGRRVGDKRKPAGRAVFTVAEMAVLAERLMQLPDTETRRAHMRDWVEMKLLLGPHALIESTVLSENGATNRPHSPTMVDPPNPGPRRSMTARQRRDQSLLEAYAKAPKFSQP